LVPQAAMNSLTTRTPTGGMPWARRARCSSTWACRWIFCSAMLSS
jgi:hypothetical protein